MNGVAAQAARARRVATGLALSGALGVAAGAALCPDTLARSYLAAFVFYTGLCLGALFLLLAHHLFNARWSVPLRRVLEHLAAGVWVMAVLALPLLLLSPRLYEWMGPSAARHAPETRAFWLNPVFFYARTALCFAIWIGLSWRLRSWSLKEDQTGDPECARSMRRLSAGGMVLYALTVTVAAVDWTQSLAPDWFSTAYGVSFFSGSVWGAIPLVWLAAAWLRRAGGLSEWIQERQLRDLGVLLLVFTLFHAYIEYSQYFIIWNANIPDQTAWHTARAAGWWRASGLLLVMGGFFLPFLLLTRAAAKTNPAVMVPLCLWICGLRFVEVSYHVLPGARTTGFPWGWTDGACVLFVGGFLAREWLGRLARHPLRPLNSRD